MDLLLACSENGDMPHLRVTCHCTENMSPVTCPNFQHLQRFVCLRVSMCACARRGCSVSSSDLSTFLFLIFFRITFYLFCVCVFTYVGVGHMHVEVRGHLEEVVYSLPGN